jgi:hypothetical protein
MTKKSLTTTEFSNLNSKSTVKQRRAKVRAIEKKSTVSARDDIGKRFHLSKVVAV